MTYAEFLKRKAVPDRLLGFEPKWLPKCLFGFQRHLTDWALRKGRAALFEDCGLGKSLQELVWAQNVVMHTNGNALVLTPLAVGAQMVREGRKFGIECKQSRDGRVHKGITVTNYEQLPKFDPKDFAAVVCDDGGILKNFDGHYRKIVTEFLRRVRYKLIATATPAPNDFKELGTLSEALGEMGYMDMLGSFFKNDEDSLHPIWWGSKWRLKKHAELTFWRWVCSWARALRKPSDLGFDDGKFVLPGLDVRQTVVEAYVLGMRGFLPKIARTNAEQLAERKGTVQQRCEKVAEIASQHKISVAWCHLDREGDLLAELVPDAVQVKGSDRDEVKEERFLAFADGQIKRLVTKPKIGGFGLNWQHCAHMTFFPSHSFEGYYQCVRRCHRFGQKRRVVVDVVTTPGERRVLRNLQRKAEAAEEMFARLVRHMNEGLEIKAVNGKFRKVEVPAWLAR